MAVKYKKGKKKLEYSGFDKVAHNFGSGLEKIKSTARSVAKKATKPSRNYRREQARKELDNVSRAFGSVDNYTKLYPDYEERAKKLHKRAYGGK